jgi:hypothetical protein
MNAAVPLPLAAQNYNRVLCYCFLFVLYIFEAQDNNSLKKLSATFETLKLSPI